MRVCGCQSLIARAHGADSRWTETIVTRPIYQTDWFDRINLNFRYQCRLPLFKEPDQTVASALTEGVGDETGRDVDDFDHSELIAASALKGKSFERAA